MKCLAKQRKKKKKKTNLIKEPKEEVSGLWEKYNDFIRSLHLQNPFQEPKVSFKRKILDYLKKILIIAGGAFLTTAAFSFFINPNGLYNNGLNGILQVITQFIIGKNDIAWSWFPLIQQGMALLLNTLIVLILWMFFKTRLEITSTALFYIVFKLIWGCLLEKVSFIFSSFSPSSWIETMGKRDLTLTLPYYVIIALVAAVIHALGVGLIIKCQATPDGHDIITTHLSIKKSKLPISWISRIFNVFTVILIVIINLYFEENEKIRESFVRRDWEKNNTFSSSKKFEEVVKQWKKEMQEIHEAEKNVLDIEGEKILQEREEKLYKAENFLFNKLLREKTSAPEKIIETFSENEYEFYIANSKKKRELIDKYISNIKEKLKATTVEENKGVRKGRRSVVAEQTAKERMSDLLTYFDILQTRKKEIEQQKDENLVKNVLRRITNNERIWATFVYIFVTSYLVGVFFPRDKIMTINIHCNSSRDVERGINLVKKFCNVCYYNDCFQEKGGRKQKLFIITCKLSRWNYYLYLPYLQQLGNIYEN